MYGNGDIKLSGQERTALREAIISAYPNIPKLKMMVDEELNENLNRIAVGENLSEVVYKLISWAKSKGKVKQLIEVAYKGNSDNPDVRKQYYNIPRSFEFETATLGKNLQINYGRRQAESFQEDLGNGIFLEMVKIPGGSFLMGSPENEPERIDSEGPQHRVNIKPFFMGKFPVTQEQYQAVMGENPSKFKGENKPVESVSWHNAVEFCNRISQRIGKAYRLPSEAEWEYACRAGTITPFYFGETISTELANYRGTNFNYEGKSYPGNYGNGPEGKSRKQTTDVGSFPPNSFGLYDMHGNVFEWCEDGWHENYDGAPNNGNARKTPNDDKYCYPFTVRGGSWYHHPSYCRSAYRAGNPPALTLSQIGIIGFRVVVAFPRIS